MEKLLIVEDNFAHGRALVQAAKEAGFDPHHVVTLGEALEVLGTGGTSGFSAVLLDTTLPDGDAEEALGRLSASSPMPGLVFLHEGEAEGTLGPAGLPMLAKPVQSADLTRAVRAGVKGVKGLTAAPTAKQSAPKARAKAARTASLPADADCPCARLASDESLPSLKAYRDETEKQYLLALLERHGDDAPTAVATAEVSRASYYNLLKKHGLSPKQKG